MKFLAPLGALSALACVTSAEVFKVKSKSADSRFDGLCLYSLHTGAGLGNADLGPCEGARPWRLENHRLEYYGYNGPTPGGLDYFSGDHYKGYEGPVTINLGRGTKGIWYDDHRFTHFNNKYSGLDWVACTTKNQAGAKPLYSANEPNPQLPYTCGKVKLVKEYF